MSILTQPNACCYMKMCKRTPVVYFQTWVVSCGGTTHVYLSSLLNSRCSAWVKPQLKNLEHAPSTLEPP